MKTWLKTMAWVVVMAVGVPPLFIFAYFFPLVVASSGRLELLRALVPLALAVSWVSAPFFAAAVLLYRALTALRAPGYVTFAICALAGYLWVAVWNHVIDMLFAYGRSILPVLVCCSVTVGYALARRFYFSNQPPLPKKENSGADLPG